MDGLKQFANKVSITKSIASCCLRHSSSLVFVAIFISYLNLRLIIHLVYLVVLIKRCLIAHQKHQRQFDSVHTKNKELRCIADGDFECLHIGFVLALPEVRMALKTQ
jgi:hypothetical protein